MCEQNLSLMVCRRAMFWQSLDPNKAVGIEGIDAKMLLHQISLTSLFSYSLENGELPRE